MAEQSEASLPPKEQSPLSRKIIVEPGRHPLTDKEFSAVAGGFKSGNLRIHAWNKEVGERLGKRNTAVLAIDSLVPSPDGNLNYASKAATWIFLPDRPLSLNKEGVVRVLRGDTMGLVTEREESDMQNVKNSVQESYEKTEFKRNIANFLEYSLGGALAYAVTTSMVDTALKKKISRRGFTKTMLGLGASAFATAFSARRIIPEGAAKSLDDQSLEILTKITESLKPVLTTDIVTDGRTGIILTKMEEATELGLLSSDQPSALVLGYSHLFEANPLQQDLGYRNQKISDYLTKITGTITEVLNNYPHLPKKMVINEYLDSFDSADILKITDPGGPDINPDLYGKVDSAVELESSFKSKRIKSLTDKFRL